MDENYDRQTKILSANNFALRVPLMSESMYSTVSCALGHSMQKINSIRMDPCVARLWCNRQREIDGERTEMAFLNVKSYCKSSNRIEIKLHDLCKFLHRPAIGILLLVEEFSLADHEWITCHIVYSKPNLLTIF